MSDTPITDHADMNDYMTAVEVARKLERELAAMTAERDGLKARFAEALAMQHHWNGNCPDMNVGMDSRDPSCPACRALMELTGTTAQPPA